MTVPWLEWIDTRLNAVKPANFIQGNTCIVAARGARVAYISINQIRILNAFATSPIYSFSLWHISLPILYASIPNLCATILYCGSFDRDETIFALIKCRKQSVSLLWVIDRYPLLFVLLSGYFCPIFQGHTNVAAKKNIFYVDACRYSHGWHVNAYARGVAEPSQIRLIHRYRRNEYMRFWSNPA